MDEAVIYTILGEEGFTKMVAAFYKRVKTDDLIGPMYPEQDFAGAEERLRDFLLFVLAMTLGIRRSGGIRGYVCGMHHFLLGCRG